MSGMSMGVHVKFEVRSLFNRFKLVSLTGPLRKHTQMGIKHDTSNGHIISAIHSVHLAEIIKIDEDFTRRKSSSLQSTAL